MYLADSESSSIRRVDLTTGGSKLLAGGDPTFSDNLFQVRFEWRDYEVDKFIYAYLYTEVTA